VTTHCQLSCVACNHCAPLWRFAGPRWARVAQVEQDLSRLAKIVHTPLWGALGGEPLFHPQLVDILRVARQSGIADALEVWTNGLRIRHTTPEFWRSFDILVLSLYPGVDVDVEWARHKCQEEGVQLVVKDEREMRNFRSLLEPVPTPENVTRRKFQNCFFRGFSRVANEGYFFTCCVSPQLPYLLQQRPYGDNGLAITEDLTETELQAFLDRQEPLGCCDICASHETALPVLHQQQRDVYEWLKASGLS
jgi:GTP 3',8-cyclase